MEVIVGGRYRHYKKGTVYTVVGFSHHTEDDEKLVLYKPDVEPDNLKNQYPEGVVFARPFEQFASTTEFNGKAVQRFEPIESEETFVAEKGQVDYSNIHWAPVVNCVVVYQEKLLLVKRNQKMRLYPGCWNGISGFLDDSSTLDEKVRTELREELGLKETDIEKIELRGIFDQPAPQVNKTWIVHAMRVEVNTDAITLDWEAEDYKWVTKEEALTHDLLPGFDEVLNAAI